MERFSFVFLLFLGVALPFVAFSDVEKITDNFITLKEFSYINELKKDDAIFRYHAIDIIFMTQEYQLVLTAADTDYKKINKTFYELEVEISFDDEQNYVISAYKIDRNTEIIKQKVVRKTLNKNEIVNLYRFVIYEVLFGKNYVEENFKEILELNNKKIKEIGDIFKDQKESEKNNSQKKAKEDAARSQIILNKIKEEGKRKTAFEDSLIEKRRKKSQVKNKEGNVEGSFSEHEKKEKPDLNSKAGNKQERDDQQDAKKKKDDKSKGDDGKSKEHKGKVNEIDRLKGKNDLKISSSLGENEKNLPQSKKQELVENKIEKSKFDLGSALDSKSFDLKYGQKIKKFDLMMTYTNYSAVSIDLIETTTNLTFIGILGRYQYSPRNSNNLYLGIEAEVFQSLSKDFSFPTGRRIAAWLEKKDWFKTFFAQFMIENQMTYFVNLKEEGQGYVVSQNNIVWPGGVIGFRLYFWEVSSSLSLGVFRSFYAKSSHLDDSSNPSFLGSKIVIDHLNSLYDRILFGLKYETISMNAQRGSSKFEISSNSISLQFGYRF